MDEQAKKELDYIIDGQHVKTVSQPIVSLRDGSVLGHEALSRITCDSEITNPEQLFRIAGESSRLWDLEQLCRTTALHTAYRSQEQPNAAKLFLNVNPNIMHDPKFKQGFTREFLQQYGMTPESIIFEITERNAVSDMSGFKGTISHYKKPKLQNCGRRRRGRLFRTEPDQRRKPALHQARHAADSKH